jgi:hypothetical protein
VIATVRDATTTPERISMKRKLTAAVLTMLAAGLAAGCGGDGKGTATTGGGATTGTGGGAPPTKAEFVAAADRICAATDAKIEAAAAKLRASATKSGTIPVPQVTRFLTKTSLPAYDELLDKLHTLVPPKGDEKAIDGLVAALAGAIDTAKADPVKYSKNGTPDPFDDANARAQRYGMKVCGS